MGEEKKYKHLKFWKRAFITLLIFVGVQVLFRFMLTTSPVHNFVKNKAVAIANESLNGTLSIGRLDGDLWKEVLLTDVLVTQQDTLLSADSIYASYDIWSFLSDLYVVNSVKVAGVKAKIQESPDSVLNLQTLVKVTEESGPEIEDSTSSASLNLLISDIRLRNINARIYMPSLLPDSVLAVRNLNARSSFMLADTMGVSLNSLSFFVDEGRLPEPIRVNTSASYINEEITLNQLVIETGRSMLNAQGIASLADSTMNSQLKGTPFSLADIKPYLEQDIPEETFSLSLGISGSADSLRVSLNLTNEYIGNLEVYGGVSFQGEPELKYVGMLGQGLNVGHYISDTTSLSIAEMRVSAKGNIPAQPENMDIVWGFDFSNITYEQYFMPSWFGSGIIENGTVSGSSEMFLPGDQYVRFSPVVRNISSEFPEWSLGFILRNINPGIWTENEALDGKVTIFGDVSGKGFSLSRENWLYELESEPIAFKTDTDGKPVIETTPAYIAGQRISGFGIKGAVNQDSATAAGFVQLNQSKAEFSVSATNLASENMNVRLSSSSQALNLAEIVGLEDLRTALTYQLHAEGSGFDLNSAYWDASFKMDTSVVNGALLQSFETRIHLQDGVLNIEEGLLSSEIAEGTFRGRKNLSDPTDNLNRLFLDMMIKNVQPLAGVAGFNVMRAQGNINGYIQQDSAGFLSGDLAMDLKGIRVDSLFTASRIVGDAKGRVREVKEMEVNISIEEPVVSGITLEDIDLNLGGFAGDDFIDTDFNLKLSGGESGVLVQSGVVNVNIPEEQIDIRFDQFDFETPGSLLELQHAFNVSIAKGALTTDTMKVGSTTGAFLELSIPYADSLEQRAWARGDHFDFGIIQEIIFGERFLDGVLSGNLTFGQHEDSLNSNGQINIVRLNYKEVEIDSLSFTFNIAREQLQANGSVTLAGEEKIAGNLNIPFALKDNAELAEEFFTRPVLGELQVNPVELNRFSTILADMGITETDGILSVNGQVSGTAGNPRFSGALSLENPVLSGVPVDSVFASFEYDHNQGKIFGKSQIEATGQRAAEVDVEIPFHYDFRSLEVSLPGEEEQMRVYIKTENFNIAVFNDFLDRDILSGLRGTLNADLTLVGALNEMDPKGYLTLTGGRVNVPIAGLTLENMVSDVEFTSQGLNVKNISLRSGPGDMRVNGTVGLEGITPKDLNLNIRANQFRVARTPQVNMVIDLNSRLAGSVNTPKATGKLTVKNGFFMLPDFGEDAVEEVRLEGEPEVSISFYDSLAVEMEFEVERNFFVRSRSYLDMEIEVAGEVDATKETNGDLSLFGTMRGIQGYVRPLGKRFNLQEADVLFSGPLNDPDISVRSSYVPPTQQDGESIKIYYVITGTLQDPNYAWESDPEMEEREILCYTIFNNPCDDGWQDAIVGNSGALATDILADVLLDRVESLASQELGVDVVQIDNAGGDDGVTIKTGWYLNQRTFFAIINEISGADPKTLFLLEYMLSEHWDLILQQGQSRSGIDFRFQFDY